MVHRYLRYSCAVLFLSLLLSSSVAFAQKPQTEDYDTRRARAFELYKQQNQTAAMELFEVLAVENPRDREVLMMTGILVITHAANYKDAEQKKKERVRGRQLLVRAKELGAESTMLKTLLETIPPDGDIKETIAASEAEEIMHDAEIAFAKGDFKKALEAYSRALEKDPKLYLAALFSGDVYRKTGEHDKAAEWFKRAIAIDPDAETAYRYWGEMLTLNGDLDAARDKLVEAFVLSPFYRLTSASLIMWSERKQIELAHPHIEIPEGPTSSGEGKTNITIDPSMLGSKDGKSAWLVYAITRANWKNEKFKKNYPSESSYRHSLAEEADALRMVLISLAEQMKGGEIKNLDPSLARLKALNDAGLLEAYILLARTDAGIAQDYDGYARKNRANLRRYVVEYVLTGGGK